MSLGTLLAFVVGIPLAAQTVEFNRDIRPVLSDRCYSCHGPDAGNRKANFRLDREDDARPKLAKVLERITSTSPVKRMPPAYAGHDKLPDKDIAAIRRWIEQGAPWQNHWSFLPPRRAPGTTLDSVIKHGALTPAPAADRATLLRRVTFDLTGLPPTPDEVDAFVRDGDYEKVVDRLLASPRYAERMAIRWLEAARYADTNGYQSDGPRDMWRWRDWVLDAFNSNMPFDRFTIEQIAGDLLPDRTLDQRIATGFHRNHRTSAEGGIVDEEFRVDYVADRTETTSTVWLGLTMGCARCHDHKYDPMKQRDFYSLFAFFNNVPEKGFVYDFGNEPPFIKAPLPDQAAKLAALDRKIEALRVAIWQGDVARPVPPVPTADNWTITDGLVFRYAAARKFNGKDGFDVPGKNTARFDYRDPFTFSAWITPTSPQGAILSRAEDYMEGSGHSLLLMDGKLRLHVVFRWTDLGLRVESAAPLRMNERQHVLVTYDGSMQAAGARMYVNGRQVATKILFDQGIWPIGVKEPLRLGAGSGLRFNGEMEDARVYARALSPEEAAVIPLSGPLNPDPQTDAERTRLRLARLERNPLPELAQLAALRAERKKFYESIPTVMVMEERERPRDAFILKRGAYDAHGDKVTAATPGFLPPFREDWPRNRLGLARWLVDRSNPLTARVTVNRFWQMMFGTGLVKTVEDFGSQGEWPVQQEALDWLACEFMDSGWDVKHVLKTIVMSSTYRQSSKASPEDIARDPENRLLARGPRIRLSPEMIRDQALAASGLLVERLGGPSVKPYQPAGLWQELSFGGRGYVEDEGEGLYRRTLYSYWKRTVAPPSMVNFDSPNRETCTVRETRTNTPLQALDLMNDITFVEAARKLAERMIAASGTAPGRIDAGYRRVLGRIAKPAERDVLAVALAKFEAAYRGDPKAAREFVAIGKSPRASQAPDAELAAYTGIASILLNLDETVTKP